VNIETQPVDSAIINYVFKKSEFKMELKIIEKAHFLKLKRKQFSSRKQMRKKDHVTILWLNYLITIIFIPA